MRKTVVQEGETARELAARVGVPLCMLLRANRVFSASWLLPGREIDVPGGDFCLKDAFPCPARMVLLPAVTRRAYIRREGETRAQTAQTLGVPLRLIPVHERAFAVFQAREGWRVVTAGLKVSLDAEERAVNGLFGFVFPGTQLMMKIR